RRADDRHSSAGLFHARGDSRAVRGTLEPRPLGNPLLSGVRRLQDRRGDSADLLPLRQRSDHRRAVCDVRRTRRLPRRPGRAARAMTIRIALVGIATVLVAQSARTVWDGVYSDTQARRGEAVYTERCASCHAPDLSGIDQAAPLVGADFLTEWNDLT